MRLENFIKIAEYGNTNWKGSFTPEEVRQNAEDYFVEWTRSKEQGKATHTMEELCKLLIEDIEECNSEEAEDFLYDILYDAEDTWSCNVYRCEHCGKREIVFFTEEQIFQLQRYHGGNPRKLLIQNILPNCSAMVREYEREYRYCLCEECWKKFWNGELRIR